MTPRLDLVGVVVSDLARSIDFYRRLGLEFTEGAESSQGHAEATLPNGLRFALDTVETVRTFDPDWQPASGGHHCPAGAFLCDSPAEVDAKHEELVAADGNVVDLFAPLE